MSISHVLSLGSLKALINNKIPEEKGLKLQEEALLFSLLLSDILGIKQEAKEQGTEGLLPAPSLLFTNGISEEDNARQNNLGQNMYQQTLQNIFPAGKDANSGLNGEHNQEGILLSQIALPVVQGSKLSISREISSLSPAELDRYINTLELLRELSGQIRGSYVISSQQQTVEKGNTQVLSKDNERSYTNLLPIEGKEQIGVKQLEVSGISQQNSSKEEKASNEVMLHKSEPQLSIPGQHMIYKMESTLIGDKTIVRPEMTHLVSGKIWDQVMNLLKRQDFSQVKELSIQLHPAELGKVNFSVKLENGQIHLIIHALENSTANFLQNNLTELRNNLLKSGIDCGTLEMGYNDNRQYGSNREFNNEEDNSLSGFLEEEKTYYPGFVSAMSINGSGSRINVKA